MSLLMLKTKNLSWQDHTLNIEVMLAPLRSTLLLNKHKTLDTKFDKEKALYERQREACINDYILETRLIGRRRQKILNRKKEIQAEARSKSAIEKEQEAAKQDARASNQERSSSAPVEGRTQPEAAAGEQFHPTFPRLGLRHTPLFGGNPLRPRLFLETGSTAGPSSESDGLSHLDNAGSRRPSLAPSSGTFLTGDGQLSRRPSSLSHGGKKGNNSQSQQTSARQRKGDKSPKRTQLPPTIIKTPAWSPSPNDNRPTPPTHPRGGQQADSKPDRGMTRRLPNVTFLNFLDQASRPGGDGDDDDEDGVKSGLVVEVKQKTLEAKVREFIRELDNFNSRPPTACSATNDSVYSSARSRDAEWTKMVPNRYHNLAQDRKLLEQAFDRYCDKKTHEDLLKAMKMASKMKAHTRHVRNTSMVPTIAAFKSSRTFMKILKRQQRRDRHVQDCQKD